MMRGENQQNILLRNSGLFSGNTSINVEFKEENCGSVAFSNTFDHQKARDSRDKNKGGIDVEIDLPKYSRNSGNKEKCLEQKEYNASSDLAIQFEELKSRLRKAEIEKQNSYEASIKSESMVVQLKKELEIAKQALVFANKEARDALSEFEQKLNQKEQQSKAKQIVHWKRRTETSMLRQNISKTRLPWEFNHILEQKKEKNDKFMQLKNKLWETEKKLETEKQLRLQQQAKYDQELKLENSRLKAKYEAERGALEKEHKESIAHLKQELVSMQESMAKVEAAYASKCQEIVEIESKNLENQVRRYSDFSNEIDNLKWKLHRSYHTQVILALRAHFIGEDLTNRNFATQRERLLLELKIEVQKKTLKRQQYLLTQRMVLGELRSKFEIQRKRQTIKKLKNKHTRQCAKFLKGAKRAGLLAFHNELRYFIIKRQLQKVRFRMVTYEVKRFHKNRLQLLKINSTEAAYAAKCAEIDHIKKENLQNQTTQFTDFMSKVYKLKGQLDRSYRSQVVLDLHVRFLKEELINRTFATNRERLLAELKLAVQKKTLTRRNYLLKHRMVHMELLSNYEIEQQRQKVTKFKDKYIRQRIKYADVANRAGILIFHHELKHSVIMRKLQKDRLQMVTKELKMFHRNRLQLSEVQSQAFQSEVKFFLLLQKNRKLRKSMWNNILLLEFENHSLKSQDRKNKHKNKLFKVLSESKSIQQDKMKSRIILEKAILEMQQQMESLRLSKKHNVEKLFNEFALELKEREIRKLKYKNVLDELKLRRGQTKWKKSLITKAIAHSKVIRFHEDRERVRRMSSQLSENIQHSLKLL